ncbi:DUF6879 family protein [Streptomyces boncukensis]|uniref:DUF6879 domain-containing protein n=1 Tax=Streptomyces boncukensis TaxID=2711219 RepID=A0A6G4X5N5_9ACTN|nr:DUF6879 family protein [Streptomyces boncukensis]NGO72708.1 hypothetical protein [Streptomyces boncukensis]
MFGLDQAQGEHLSLAEYQSEFRRRQWEIDGQDSWKLERGQHFQEPGFGSWEAFSRGEWEEALRLVEEERDFLQEFSERVDQHAVTLFRVRVAEEPVTPYLQWEFHLLRLRAELGERIRVVSPGQLSDLEKNGEHIPELLTLGNHTVYRIRYTEQGVLDGAVRFSDAGLVARLRQFMTSLYSRGEDISSYFARVIAPMPPPRVEAGHQR